MAASDQHNNRLLRTEVSDAGGLIERTWYAYGPDGNVARVVRWPEGAATVQAWWLYYDTAGNLWMAVSVVQRATRTSAATARTQLLSGHLRLNRVRRPVG